MQARSRRLNLSPVAWGEGRERGITLHLSLFTPFYIPKYALFTSSFSSSWADVPLALMRPVSSR